LSMRVSPWMLNSFGIFLLLVASSSWLIVIG
jgi:hypothetical protein